MRRFKGVLAACAVSWCILGFRGDPADAATGAGGASPATVPSVREAIATGGQGLTSRQKLDYADETLAEIGTGVKRIEKEAEVARKEKDIIRLNCLQQRLAVLKSLQSIAQEASDQVRTGIEKENADQAAEGFRRIAATRVQAQKVVEEAEACVGEAETGMEGAGGRWSLAVSGGDGIPEDYGADPSGYTRPPEATPFH